MSKSKGRDAKQPKAIPVEEMVFPEPDEPEEFEAPEPIEVVVQELPEPEEIAYVEDDEAEAPEGVAPQEMVIPDEEWADPPELLNTAPEQGEEAFAK
jgi:hypothetical protein